MNPTALPSNPGDSMTLKTILAALLDAAEKVFPQFAFLLEYLRPFVTAALPDDGPVVLGTGGVAAAPPDVITAVTDFLTGLMDGTSRPLVKVGLRVLISLVPFLVNSAWDSLFPNTPKEKFSGPKPDFDAVLAAADVP